MNVLSDLLAMFIYNWWLIPLIIIAVITNIAWEKRKAKIYADEVAKRLNKHDIDN